MHILILRRSWLEWTLGTLISCQSWEMSVGCDDGNTSLVPSCFQNALHNQIHCGLCDYPLMTNLHTAALTDQWAKCVRLAVTLWSRSPSLKGGCQAYVSFVGRDNAPETSSSAMNFHAVSRLIDHTEESIAAAWDVKRSKSTKRLSFSLNCFGNPGEGRTIEPFSVCSNLHWWGSKNTPLPS